MSFKIVVLLLVIQSVVLINGASLGKVNTNSLTYTEIRDAVIKAESQLMEGGTIYLSPKEKQVEDVLLKLKEKDFTTGITESLTYAPSLHFFKAKPLIDKSLIFKYIKKMPKGGNLHLHNSASVSSEWVIKNLTYRPEITLCKSPEDIPLFENIHTPSGLCVDEPVPVVDLRAKAEDKDAFDKEIEKAINLYTPQPEIDYPDINIVWSRFQNMFASIGGLLDYWPVFRDFHYQILQEMYDDNVMYIELRTGMGGLLDEGGRKIESRELAEKMIEINENFKNTHPGFLGFKVIIAINRNSKPAKFESKLKLFLDLKKEFPDLIVGFDLVGQEDTGLPLSKYVARLHEISNNGRYFFHAGETNFYGSETDLNLIDAILMNATRIGHGYSLMKHPVLWNAVKARDIAIEIAPISNQVLHLVEDLRNHPAAFYISENVPIVICADDPGFWDAKALSYDMYFAFMAFTPQNAGLRVLKQLAWNSLKYSGMSVAEKQNASAEFKKSWDKFIDDALNNNLD